MRLRTVRSIRVRRAIVGQHRDRLKVPLAPSCLPAAGLSHGRHPVAGEYINIYSELGSGTTVKLCPRLTSAPLIAPALKVRTAAHFVPVRSAQIGIRLPPPFIAYRWNKVRHGFVVDLPRGTRKCGDDQEKKEWARLA